MDRRGEKDSRPRISRGRRALAVLLLGAALGPSAWASPYIPSRDDEVLASLPPGIRHTSTPAREQAAARLDVALPLAQFYISRARATGDLRYLGYAESVLARWGAQKPPPPVVLVLQATILQSRHAFPAALTELDRALDAQPDDAQAWLTRATVLRVLGRYEEASASCAHLESADAVIAQLCAQALRGLTGHLGAAYAALARLPQQTLASAAHGWLSSELAEMAVRRGESAAAARWFRESLEAAPDDAYTRAAYADLLLSERRAAETLELLAGYDSMEPMLLRIALAQQQLQDPRLAASRALLAGAFAVEERRGEAVHRREQARFLLDVAHEPAAALAAAIEDWKVQREPADALIFLRAAQAAGQPHAAAPVLAFLKKRGLEDVRLAPYLGSPL